MRIAPELIDEIVAHARATPRRSAAGWWAAADGEALAVDRAENLFASMRYRIQVDEMFRIYKLADDRSRARRWSRSTTRIPAARPIRRRPTSTRPAGWPGSLQLICSLGRRRARGAGVRDPRRRGRGGRLAWRCLTPEPLACPHCARRFSLDERFCPDDGMPLVYVGRGERGAGHRGPRARPHGSSRSTPRASW